MTQSGHGTSLNGRRLNRYDAHEALGEAMRRREFITLVGGAAVCPLIARAQQPEKPVIGFLDGRLPEAIANRLRGFHRGLRDAGYVDGENVAVLYRYAENQNDRLPTLATELARRAVAVIVASGGPNVMFAAKQASKHDSSYCVHQW